MQPLDETQPWYVIWILVLNYLRLVDMIAMKFVCRRFNEIINDSKRFREHIKTLNGIICKKLFDDFFVSIF